MLQKIPRPIVMISFVISAIAVAYAGVRVGRMLRPHTNAQETITAAPEYPFAVGDVFPDVALTDSTETVVSSRTALGDRGAVVLFIDPDCESCELMCRRWEGAIQQGWIEVERVVAVCRVPRREIVSDFRAKHALTFAIYRDVEGVFLREHGVARYPLEVVVGTSGTVRSTSYDSETPIDLPTVALHMAE